MRTSTRFIGGGGLPNEAPEPYICGFGTWMQPTTMQPHDDFDPVAVHKEAAMFYGLFLRGHSPDKLRADIDIPKPMIEKWLQHRGYEGDFREGVKRVYAFRKQVLAVFDELVDREKIRVRIQ